MKTELKVYDVGSTIEQLETIDDPFVQEIIRLWETYNRHGRLYCHLVTDDLQSQIVSFVLLETSNDYTIRGTWTHPDYRKQGLGTVLLNKIIFDSIRSDKVDCIWVNITPGAEYIYEKVEFNIYGKRTDCEPNLPVGIYSLYPRTIEEQLIKAKFKQNFTFS